MDSGEDLTDGILAVDGARALLNTVRRGVKGVMYHDLRDGLLALVDGWRAFLTLRLQYFLNMVLFPVVGHGKEKVRIHFEGCWLEPREFTINVKPNEKRGFKHESSFFLKSLNEVVQDITESLVDIKDFIQAFANLKIADQDLELLLPLIKRVLDAAFTAKKEDSLDRPHRLHQL